MKKVFSVIMVLAVAIFFGISYAMEHPGEHPAEAAKAEHPGKAAAAEHPGKAAGQPKPVEHPAAAAGQPVKTSEHPPHGVAPGEKITVSADKIINGIKGHIAGITAANNGVFPITDAVDGKALSLKLIKVHEDKVSHIKKDDAYFACTDFATADGTAMYDLDFWMKKGAGDKLEVYQTKIHKKDGAPRFTYKDDEIVEVK